MTAPLLKPSTDQVGVMWLRRNAKMIAAGVSIATTLPSDDDAQMRRGFIEARVVGGSPDRDLPIRRPVVSFSCWTAPAAGSSKVPWAHAAQLAEWIWEQTFDRQHMNVLLTFTPPLFEQARVMTAVALTEPLRVPGDEGNFARFDVDVLLNWTGV